MAEAKESRSFPGVGDTAPDFFHAAAVVDRDSVIRWANARFREFFAAGTEVVGRPCHEVVHARTEPCPEDDEHCPVRQCRKLRRAVRIDHGHATDSRPSEIECFPLSDRHSAHVDRVLYIALPPNPQSLSGQERPALVDPSPRTEILDLTCRAAACDSTAVIEGETGTGKELMARTIHALSRRAAGPFVPVDCSCYREGLLDSELFGYERGAFTGAFASRSGLVEASNGGTLFLDEVEDTPHYVQVKLLRLLENRTFRRVGSTEERTSDFRLICASHGNLEAGVHSGDLRPDFFYRIDALRIRMPPLRERLPELPELIEHLRARIGCGKTCSVSGGAMEALLEHEYPGNVRELLHVLERACVLSGGGTIQREHVVPNGHCGEDGEFRVKGGGILRLEELERRYLVWAASRFRGERRDLARALGLGERTLYRRLRAIRVGHGTEVRGVLETDVEDVATGVD